MTIQFDTAAETFIGFGGTRTTTGSGGSYRVDDAAVFVSGNQVAAINDDGVVFRATEFADATGLGLGNLLPYHVHDNGDGTFNIYYQVRDADPLPTVITNWVVTFDLATGAETAPATQLTSGAFGVTDNSMIYNAHSLPNGNIFVVPFTFEGDNALIVDPMGTVLHTGDTIGGRGFTAANSYGSDVTVSGDLIFYAWVDSTSGEAGSTHLQVFDMEGNEVVAPQMVSDAVGSGFGLPPSVQVATLSDGRVVVVWTDAGTQAEDTSGTSTWFKIYNTDGTLSVDSTLVNTITSGNQDTPMVIATESGFLIGYTVFSFSPTFVNEGRLREYDNSGTLIDSQDGTHLAGSSAMVRIDNNSAIILSGNAMELILPGSEGSLDPSGSNETGDGGNNTLTGTPLGDRLDGAGGNDSIDGLGDNDTLIGGDGNDTIDGGAGNDSITGGPGDDSILGGAGDDTINDGRGNDTVDAGDGNDTYVRNLQEDGFTAGQFGDVTVDLQLGQLFGQDVPQFPDFIANFENAILGGTQAFYLLGTDGANLLQTADGNDTIDGRGGSDTLRGGAGGDVLMDGLGDDLVFGEDGDDILVMGSGQDHFDGGAGNDTIVVDTGDDQASEYTAFGNLDTGNGGPNEFAGFADSFVDIENYHYTGNIFMTLTGTNGANELFSDKGDDSLSGLDGADTLMGGAGVDTLRGGAGDDILDGGGGGDVLDGGDGYDIADYGSATRSVRVDLQNPAISFNDAAGDSFISIEEYRTHDGIDQLRGDAGDNIFRTGGVSDRLYGRAGDDMLFGEAGADAFYGGLGADIMTGGADAGRRDRYIYFNAAETGVGAGNRDVITDYVAGEDRIELSRIDADLTQGFKQRFDFIGDAAFSGTGGELRYEQTGGVTIVQADRDGDGVADFEIELTGTHTLTTDDFLI
ncbi:calcium-binding protein [Pseudaestuariivita atlantica]|uniref:Peptidase M10 serralysin C-terminal domain-containing protein n=1 Tax=Pseudaestuariivita atlantica TaxID=1317121 RepID=A0A0L1JMD7_9RHOB|nr:calcium-binding protein [Pseudaestuariivita atlantica]KNG92919.1 hypothetical protein ATO11_15840 [Pseudaestuariivita atlantica]